MHGHSQASALAVLCARSGASSASADGVACVVDEAALHVCPCLWHRPQWRGARHGAARSRHCHSRGVPRAGALAAVLPCHHCSKRMQHVCELCAIACGSHAQRLHSLHAHTTHSCGMQDRALRGHIPVLRPMFACTAVLGTETAACIQPAASTHMSCRCGYGSLRWRSVTQCWLTLQSARQKSGQRRRGTPSSGAAPLSTAPSAGCGPTTACATGCAQQRHRPGWCSTCTRSSGAHSKVIHMLCGVCGTGACTAWAAR